MVSNGLFLGVRLRRSIEGGGLAFVGIGVVGDVVKFDVDVFLFKLKETCLFGVVGCGGSFGVGNVGDVGLVFVGSVMECLIVVGTVFRFVFDSVVESKRKW